MITKNKTVSSSHLLTQIIKENDITIDNFKIEQFKTILEEVLLSLTGKIEFNEFSDDEILKVDNNKKTHISSTIILNERHTNQTNKNVIKFSLKKIFTQILDNNIDNNIDNYKYNYKHFNEAFKYIFRECSLLNDKDKGIIKMWLNFVFGLTNSTNSLLICTSDVRLDIVTELNEYLQDIYEYYKNNIIYIDTDTIYFKFNNKLMDELQKSLYPFNIDYIDNFIITNKKKFIHFSDEIRNSEDFKMKGFIERI